MTSLPNSSDALTLLRRARVHVRAQARSPDYYRAADAFSEVFLGRAFQIPPDYFQAVGTDYSAIDCLYEALVPGGSCAGLSVEAVTERLQEMTRREPAQRALGVLGPALEAPSCETLDVCRALLGAITVLGHEALARRSAPTLREDWSRLWQDVVWRQNSQQARLQRLIQIMRAPSADKPALLATLGADTGALREALEVRSTDFVQGVHEYLERYAETGAASVALVGGLPFAQGLSDAGLAELLRMLQGETDFLGHMARLMRFAQDVRFDPGEPLNTGVMAYAAESRERLVDVEAARLPKARLDAGLRAEWDVFLARTRRYFDGQLASLQDDTLRPRLEGFVTGFFAIAARLAEAGHDP